MVDIAVFSADILCNAGKEKQYHGSRSHSQADDSRHMIYIFFSHNNSTAYNSFFGNLSNEELSTIYLIPLRCNRYLWLAFCVAFKAVCRK